LDRLSNLLQSDEEERPTRDELLEQVCHAGYCDDGEPHAQNGVPSLLDVVALLTDRPAHRLARGQVGTVVEQLGDKSWLVEFSDEHGCAYAFAPCRAVDLLVLHYVPEAA
jgi:hypothetical protein